MKKCPMCGYERFYVRARISEEWLVDSDGEYIQNTASPIKVVHYPGNKDNWVCAECGYNDVGSVFEVEDK